MIDSNYQREENKKLIIWINGKKVDSTFEIIINHTTNSLKRLADKIIYHLDYPRQYLDKILIFNYKGLEIDDADIEYLHNGQVLYVSFDGNHFNVLNYVYEYEFVKWIKSGGYGKVFLGKHVLFKDFYVAIKKIDISYLSTDEIYNISREALYLESFKHKNIIKFINTYIYENHFYTVMDHAEGGELNSYLSEQKILSENECKRIFKQLHDAVTYIHSKNVIHRDLKPNNILFLDKNRENLLVIDFGISGYNSGNIKETIKAGTTKFIPPELAAGLTYSSSPKFDVWAMGVILFLMLFGYFPFDSSKEGDLINKIIKENHKFPTNIIISKTGYALINALLEKNPQLRIEMNDSLFDEWYNDNSSSDKPIVKEAKKTINIDIDDCSPNNSLVGDSNLKITTKNKNISSTISKHNRVKSISNVMFTKSSANSIKIKTTFPNTSYKAEFNNLYSDSSNIKSNSTNLYSNNGTIRKSVNPNGRQQPVSTKNKTENGKSVGHYKK